MIASVFLPYSVAVNFPLKNQARVQTVGVLKPQTSLFLYKTPVVVHVCLPSNRFRTVWTVLHQLIQLSTWKHILVEITLGHLWSLLRIWLKLQKKILPMVWSCTECDSRQQNWMNKILQRETCLSCRLLLALVKYASVKWLEDDCKGQGITCQAVFPFRPTWSRHSS